jgi:hypothetical protein
MFTIVSYQSAFIVVNSALYFASKLINLASDNPTDNNTSTYGAEMLQQLKETGVESMSARSEYVAIGPDVFNGFII